MANRIAATSAVRAGLVAAAALGSLMTACSSNSTDMTAGTPTQLVLVAGDFANGTVGSAVGPFSVKVTDSAGVVVPNVAVTFTASSGLSISTTSAMTNQDGTTFTAGTLSHVAGLYTITAKAAGISDSVVFHITASPDSPTSIILAGGDAQSAPTGTQVGEVLAVRISDQFGNPVNGITVTWTSPRGTIGTASGHTGTNGVSQTTYAPAAGLNTVTATATINNVATAVAFSETGT